ncbi:hypothetical protein BD94_4032 [Elizabethkingia anophelis NUHP1]|uniref:Uncharacterized protein n=2 Tax=Elizabethkingia anophelis TaxID=1117645 RepID=A0A077EJX8_9FLAO|nr:hypothetical protein BD94_4032 [Elizabethkingia anophelis NUHP1]
MKINNPQYIKTYIDRNFEFILTQIYKCYKMMLEDYDTVENNENKLKNRLYRDYLNNQRVRNLLGLNNFIFKTETALIDGNYNERGYSDIEVIDLKKSFYSTEASYIIECKRLDSKNPNNKKSLYRLYIEEGINRFIKEKYPSYFGVNGMLGFIVEKTNIESQFSSLINLENYLFIENYNSSYKTEHETVTNKNVILYHLMFDFSNKISLTLKDQKKKRLN